jgi:curved DNA-binding protein CbpA
MSLKPTAQGTLQKTPFAHLLVYMLGRKLSGTLAVWPDPREGSSGTQDRVLFRDGSVVAVRPRAPGCDPESVLVALFSRTDGPYGFYAGQNLLGNGESTLTCRVDSYTLLSTGLRAHPRAEIIEPVLQRIGSRTIRIRPGVPLARLDLSPKELALVDVLRAGPSNIDQMARATDLPFAEVKRLFCLFALIRGIEATDGSPGLSPVSLETVPPPASGSEPPAQKVELPPPPRVPDLHRTAAGASPAAPPAFDTPRPHTGHSLPPAGRPSPTGLPSARPSQTSLPPARASQTSLPPERASQPGFPGRTSFVSHGALPPAADEQSLSGELPLPAPPLPSGLGFEDKARWLELAALYDSMDDKTHFVLLGVPDNVGEREVQAAYFAAIKRFHPDRLPPALAPLTRCAQLLFERLTEAHETLSNPELRAAYVAQVQDGGGTRAAERMMRDVLESALEFQKAEVLMKRREYNQALKVVNRAISRNANESEYHALQGWLLHLMNTGEGAPTDDMLRAFERALKINDKNERAHYYKGVVLKRVGRDNEALRHFRLAAELNPRNVDAAREVRLASMRRHSKAPPPPTGGILSKLFRGPNKEKS